MLLKLEAVSYVKKQVLGSKNHHKVNNGHRIIVAAASTLDKLDHQYCQDQLLHGSTTSIAALIRLWGTPRVGDQTSFLMHIREMKLIFIKHHLKYQERDIQQKHAQ